ncbi:MAG: biopolymer transporter ExbD [Nevskia sp.]|nr:biopolymer transporter ExbD [Nevskia sp.]
MQGLSRELRRASRRARRKRANELNIVSMIDILTVLVFFLLVNATGVSILGINLPSSEASPPQQQPKGLKVVIRRDGFTVADASGPLKQLPVTATGEYDLQGLGDFIGQIKDREPAEDKIALLLEPGITYNTLVQVMDTVRVQPAGPGHPQRDLFPQIAVGDAPQAAPAAAAPQPAAAAPAGGGAP